ncbi:hypothetical protein ACERIT_09060 [Halopenitus sp. H-Gu1]|uniref:hypothetical protein n=1 Tax=Halopenitus sp. H-Gu1 TaxID=3242697 RepID=UPI00359DA767
MDTPHASRVRRTLKLLSTRTDTDRESYTAIIDEACAARDDLERAAGFLETVGIDRLEAAIEAAEMDGAIESADRGRRAARTFRSYQQAASDGGGTREGERDDRETGGEGVGNVEGKGNVEGGGNDARSRDDARDCDEERDHLHSGGGTAKRRTGQPSS